MIAVNSKCNRAKILRVRFCQENNEIGTKVKAKIVKNKDNLSKFLLLYDLLRTQAYC